ncbi:MAG TPA: hypothetical protein VMZ91_06605 [Candidatus Paceibacterota bacterium]|nr:hypothetical protein [Candidatus Paceibacterota bacterium]
MDAREIYRKYRNLQQKKDMWYNIYTSTKTADSKRDEAWDNMTKAIMELGEFEKTEFIRAFPDATESVQKFRKERWIACLRRTNNDTEKAKKLYEDERFDA